MTQWKKRLAVVQLIYSYLINETNEQEFIQKIMSHHELDAEQLKVIETFFTTKKLVLEKVDSIKEHNWSFERSDLVVQAIVYQTFAEQKALNTSKAILIDQALITTHNFCEDSASKYVNAVLDNILEND